MGRKPCAPTFKFNYEYPMKTYLISLLAHLIIECSGSPKGLEMALQMVRKAGLVCIYGVP